MIKESRIYKGIEYVQLSELPANQQDLINHSDGRELIIKIQVDGKILNDCIQFKDYQNWYERQFNTKTSHINGDHRPEVTVDILKHAEKFVVEKI